MAYLKAASEREDVGAESLFLLGSEYAQIGLIDDARACLQRALVRAPDYAIARFQLGLLDLTSGVPESALQVWAPLDALDDADPQGDYLRAFLRGLQALIRDEFANVVRWLEQGISLNVDNPALNANMQRIVDEVRALQAQQPASDAAKHMLADAPAEAQEELPNHLFINAYTRGKPH
jgi:tetratricopeptide (TPR) repeat protein